MTQETIAVSGIDFVRPLDVDHGILEFCLARTGTGVSTVQIHLEAADGVIASPRIVIYDIRIELTFGVRNREGYALVPVVLSDFALACRYLYRLRYFRFRWFSG